MPAVTKFLNFDIDRASARTGILLTAFLPLLTIFLTHFLSDSPQKEGTPQQQTSLASGADSRLIEFCSTNVKDNRTFVLFRYGTCVVVENEKNPDEAKAQAIEILKETATPDARFVCTQVENHNLIVSYTKPVFHLRFNEDMEIHRQEIETDFRRFLTEKEQTDISEHWEPPFHAKVGLRSRARLLKDAADPVVSRVIAPSETKKTSAEHTASVSY